jgi:plasmid maintenance system killer protein
MEVRYDNTRVMELATDVKKATKKFGPQHAKGIGKRIKQLESAESVGDVFPPAPGMWHWLKEDLAGWAAGTAKDGLRVLVQPENGQKHPPIDATIVTVMEIRDYH